MEGWGEFFVAEVGAAAVLTGLIFVGLSLNLTEILVQPGLPVRALQALGLLAAVLVVGSFLLMPGQSEAAIGAEILAVGLVASLGGLFLSRQMLLVSERRFRGLLIFNLVASGLLVLAGNRGGLYWLGGAVILSFVKAQTDAWVLLVEIKR